MSTEYQAELFVPDVPLFVPKATSRIRRITAYRSLHDGTRYAIRTMRNDIIWWRVNGRTTTYYVLPRKTK